MRWRHCPSDIFLGHGKIHAPGIPCATMALGCKVPGKHGFLHFLILTEEYVVATVHGQATL